jgi:hypothetical protein
VDELSDFIAADELNMTVWQSHDAQRRPEAEERASARVARWRERRAR